MLGALTELLIPPQEQLKQLLITAGFPEGVCARVCVCGGVEGGENLTVTQFISLL